MSQLTQKLGLEIFDVENLDDQKKVKDYLKGVAGISGSNMIKIDEAFGNIDVSGVYSRYIALLSDVDNKYHLYLNDLETAVPNWASLPDKFVVFINTDKRNFNGEGIYIGTDYCKPVQIDVKDSTNKDNWGWPKFRAGQSYAFLVEKYLDNSDPENPMNYLFLTSVQDVEFDARGIQVYLDPQNPDFPPGVSLTVNEAILGIDSGMRTVVDQIADIEDSIENESIIRQKADERIENSLLDNFSFDTKEYAKDTVIMTNFERDFLQPGSYTKIVYEDYPDSFLGSSTFIKLTSPSQTLLEAYGYPDEIMSLRYPDGSIVDTVDRITFRFHINGITDFNEITFYLYDSSLSMGYQEASFYYTISNFTAGWNTASFEIEGAGVQGTPDTNNFNALHIRAIASSPYEQSLGLGNISITKSAKYQNIPYTSQTVISEPDKWLFAYKDKTLINDPYALFMGNSTTENTILTQKYYRDLKAKFVIDSIDFDMSNFGTDITFYSFVLYESATSFIKIANRFNATTSRMETVLIINAFGSLSTPVIIENEKNLSDLREVIISYESGRIKAELTYETFYPDHIIEKEFINYTRSFTHGEQYRVGIAESVVGFSLGHFSVQGQDYLVGGSIESENSKKLENKTLQQIVEDSREDLHYIFLNPYGHNVEVEELPVLSEAGGLEPSLEGTETSFQGFVDAKINGLTMINLLEQGNFATGVNKWSLSNCTATVTGQIAKATGTGVSPNLFIGQSLVFNGSNKLTVKSGDIFYVKARVRVLEAGSTNLIASLRNTSISGASLPGYVSIANPVAGQWYDISFSSTANTLGLLHLSFAASYADSATQNGKNLEIDGVHGVFVVPMLGSPVRYMGASDLSERIMGYFEGPSGSKSLKINSSTLIFPIDLKTGYFGSSNAPLQVGGFSPNTEYEITAMGYYQNGFASGIIFNYTDGTNDLRYFETTNSWKALTSDPAKTVKSAGLFSNPSSLLNTGYCSVIDLYDPAIGSRDERGKSTLEINAEMNSLPNEVSDELVYKNGQMNFIKRIGKYKIQASDLTMTAGTNATIVTLPISKLVGAVPFDGTRKYNFYFPGWTPSALPWDTVSNRHTVSADATNFNIVVGPGYYANLAAAQADLAGATIYYQLATPEYIPETSFAKNKIFVSGALQSFVNHTRFYSTCNDIRPDILLTQPGSYAESIVSIKEMAAALEDRKLSKSGGDLTGSMKFDRGAPMRNYKDVLHYALGSYTATGILKITMPMSWSNTMMSGNIKGFQYEPNKSWELSFSGYNYDVTPEWFNTAARIDGNPPFSRVRFAHDGSKCCILLGDLSTIWYYPMLSIVDFLTSVSNIDSWGTGWSAEIITGEAGLTKIVEPELQKPTSDSKRGTTTIPTTGWVANTGDNTLKCNIAITGVAVGDWVDVTIDKDYQDTASAIQLNGTVDEYAGGITIYANSAPTVAIPIRYMVVK